MYPKNISYYQNIFKSENSKINILQFLKSIKTGMYDELIFKIKIATNKEKRTELKKQLPAATISAAFNGSHNISNLTETSNFICIDIDNINNIQNTLSTIILDKYTFSVFKSPSYTGLKVIIQHNATQNRFLPLFNQLEKYYQERYNILIDKSCKNINRLCFISADKDLFLNLNSTVFEVKKETQKQVPIQKPKYQQNTTNQKINIIISAINQYNTDITQTYQEWIAIAYAIASEYGSAGAYYFHEISKYHPEYNYKKCQQQYEKCLKTKSRFININMLFKIAKDYNITYK